MATTRCGVAAIDLPATHIPLDVATPPAPLRQVEAGTKGVSHYGEAW